MNDKEKERLDNFKKHYEVHGDGVAKVKIKELAESEKFKDSVKKLAEMELDGENVK